MMWHFETKESLTEGEYTFSESGEGDTSDLKKIARTIFGSIVFDGVVLPSAGELQNALKTNNRQFLWDAFRKLKVGKDKFDRLKFYVKPSETGKTLIVFYGYSGLRSFLTSPTYGINHLKVSMISTAATINTAAKYGNFRSAGSSVVRTTAKGLSGVGFTLVATFDIAEFLLSDDPLNNWSDLYVTLGIDAVKTLIATAAGVIAGALLAGTGVGAIVVVGGIVASIATSFYLEQKDREHNITQKAQNYVNFLESGERRYLEYNEGL